jgi:hypothetical protein
VTACAAGLCVLARADVVGFAKYQPIIDRAPFGATATDTAPGAPVVSPAAEAIARTMRLAMLIFEDDGTVRAGVVNLQTQQTQILTAGEIGEDGMELVEVRADREEAVLRRGTEMVVLKMEAATESPPRTGGRPTAPGRGSRGGPTPVAGRPTVQPYSTPAETDKPLVQVVSPHLPTMDPPPPTLQGAELEKHLREYNLQAIRQGMPPLPIPLTPEEDANLVREGVLPPNE